MCCNTKMLHFGVVTVTRVDIKLHYTIPALIMFYFHTEDNQKISTNIKCVK